MMSWNSMEQNVEISRINFSFHALPIKIAKQDRKLFLFALKMVYTYDFFRLGLEYF